MDPALDRHRRLRAVFDEALLRNGAARQTYLDDACADDPELRSHVVRLLTAHHELNSFLEHPVDLRPDTPLTAQAFSGTDRFHVIRQLGAGGMGVVFEVHDRGKDEVVALKTLHRTGAADLYRLKHEFRSLADVTHRNLVCLYELFVEDGRAFFTMELVRGVSFVEYVRGRGRTHLSVERLVPAFRQLVDGVAALHRRGKLHRDIKPSNVMVTDEGRVVLLDFGLITDASPPHAGAEPTGGTPAYMSPEESAGGMPSEASDWYAVGVTFYEALTGTLPFAGPMPDVLRRKRLADPHSPANLLPHEVPSGLSAICMGLLHRAPADRLTGATALRALASGTVPLVTGSGVAQDVPFVGRDEQLDALHGARDAVVQGSARAVVVHGSSGIGKTALVRRFLSGLRRDGVVVLAGRCYENESVPFKALDGIVDDLSRYLGSLPADRAARLLPSDLSALTRAFPVLLQVDAVAGRARSTQADLAADPLEVRRRAIEALSAVLDGIARDRSLVAWIDDLQWADADSMVMLEELLGSPAAPTMLTLLCVRREELAAKPFLRALLDRVGRPGWSAVSLEPMTGREAGRLLDELAARGSALTDVDKRQIALEADGSPFVLEQLAVHVGGPDARDGASPTLAGAIGSRLQALSTEARLVLETLAVCARPVAVHVVCDACGVMQDRQSLVVRLRASRLIRSSVSADSVETYHDRIRTVVAGQLSGERLRDIHRRMAASLVAARSEEHDALFEHYRGAGDREQATAHARLAAERANAALAFDRAASFYRHAIELTPSAPDAGEWREGLAMALANAGRPAEAAESYLAAARDATAVRHIELQRRAAQQFLIGGHIDSGLDLMRRVLDAAGLRGAASPREAVLWLMWRRVRLHWRGLHFRPRLPAEVEPDVLMRIDTCWALATGLGLVDLLHASNFIAQHLHMALDAGEPSRIARGAALEWAARQGYRPFRNRSAPLRDLAARLAADLGTPQAGGIMALADSIAASAVGQWKRALSSSERALAILRDQCVGVTWEITIAQNVAIWALMYLGEIGEVSRRVPALLADARRRGNLYLATELSTRSNYVWLAADDPEGGEREAMDAVAQWSQKGFHRQHYSALLARVQTALYRGDGATAWRLLDEQQQNLRRSMLTRVQAFRIESEYLRARSAIAVAVADPSNRQVLSVARDCARRIAREGMPWSDPIALLMQAGIASAEGHRAIAETHLHGALERFTSADMQLYAAVTKRRIGAVRADEQGRTLQREAEAWMAAQQIRNPVCLTRMLAPGFTDEPLSNSFPGSAVSTMSHSRASPASSQ